MCNQDSLSKQQVEAIKGIIEYPMAALSICGHFADEGVRTPVDLYKSWPMWNRANNYPIPGGVDAYVECGRVKGFWKGSQGMYRVSLLEHMLEKLEKHQRLNTIGEH